MGKSSVSTVIPLSTKTARTSSAWPGEPGPPLSVYLDCTGLKHSSAISTRRPGHTSIAAGELGHGDVEGGCGQCCGWELRVSALEFGAQEGCERRGQKVRASSLEFLPRICPS